MIGIVIVAAVLATSPVAAPKDDAATVLERLQARYVEAPALSFRFIERYRSQRTGSVLEESGILYTQRPGRMRWEYRLPESKLFVLADGLGWFYLPEDAIVYRMRTGGGGAQRLPSLFLAGEGDLNRDFAARFVHTEPTIRLELRPRALGESYDYLLLDIEARSFALLTLTVVDAMGNQTEFGFHDEEPNPVLPKGAFRFTVPEDVEVVEAVEADGR